ncbi:hypothetical protein [Agrobacterium sp. Azo12]|uniref:hypothetical protein n=1 Tax=Agrobacterium sp. Azo12 TaxID=3031129 RepID=UPI0023D82B59|nr:hypothetical protein [Agrobacterium sp. Azo12]MDO5896958.1 hypothetical protein [Agrobacterium sp. Azo12]
MITFVVISFSAIQFETVMISHHPWLPYSFANVSAAISKNTRPLKIHFSSATLPKVKSPRRVQSISSERLPRLENKLCYLIGEDNWRDAMASTSTSSEMTSDDGNSQVKANRQMREITDRIILLSAGEPTAQIALRATVRNYEV